MGHPVLICWPRVFWRERTVRPERYRGTGCPENHWHKCGSPWGPRGVLSCPHLIPASSKCPRGGCVAPISQPRKGQRPRVGLAVASHSCHSRVWASFRTVPRPCSWRAACRGQQGAAEAGTPPSKSWGPLAWCPPRGQWLLILLGPRAAWCVLR